MTHSLGPVISYLLLIITPEAGGCYFIFSGRHVYFLGHPRPPTPQPPPPVPPPDKKGYHSAPFGILHPSGYSSILETIMPQSYGAKIEMRTPMHYTWPTRHPWLACTVPHCFYFFRISLTISCWHNPVSLGLIAASLAWLTPRPAPSGCFWLLEMSTDSLFYPILKEGAFMVSAWRTSWCAGNPTTLSTCPEYLSWFGIVVWYIDPNSCGFSRRSGGVVVAFNDL